MQQQKSKVVVTGGAGFIGSHVADLLVEKGYEVHAVDNFLTGKRENLNPRAILHEADIRDLEVLPEIFAGAQTLFHLAAQARMQYSIEEPRLTNDINVTGTINVLLAAKEAGVKRVVYSASSSAYGDGHTLPLREDMEPRPIIPYAIQKRVGEQYCQMFSRFYGLQTFSLRYFNVYGPRQTTESDGPYATVIGIFLEERQKGKPMSIVPDGKQRRDFTHVRDVARANILAAESSRVGKGEIINIGSGKNFGILEAAQLIGGPWEFIEPRQGEVRETLADIKKAKEFLGWEPEIPFEKGIHELKKIHGLA